MALLERGRAVQLLPAHGTRSAVDVTGAGDTVMAAFTHLNPEGSRFSDGSYGVYYAAHSLETAIAEVSHHRGVFLRRTHEPAIDVDMRLITASVEAELHDLLEAEGEAANTDRYAAVLDPDDYGSWVELEEALAEADTDTDSGDTSGDDEPDLPGKPGEEPRGGLKETRHVGAGRSEIGVDLLGDVLNSYGMEVVSGIILLVVVDGVFAVIYYVLGI